MATLRQCTSHDEMWDAWKVGLLVNGMGNSILSYSTYTEEFGVPQINYLYSRHRHNVFILVEDEED